MTSKQALEQLLYYAKSDDSGFGPYMKDCAETISRDLEVLEHLKALFNGFKVLEKNGIKYKNMYLLCKNSRDDLVREWLEK